MIRNLVRGLERFAYEAAEYSPNRKSKGVDLRREDHVLDAQRRDRASSNTRELRRNFAIAAWGIRTHCNFVASQRFQARTADKGFNRELEARYLEQTRKENCDAAGRHDFDKLILLAEGGRTCDGEVLVEGHEGSPLLGIIEADGIADPEKPELEDGETLVNGVVINRYGRALRYYVGQRNSAGKIEDPESVDASRVYQHGFFERPSQVRGISPLLAALDDFQDIDEANGYALAKAKVAQMIAAVFKHGEDWEPDDANPNRKLDLSKGVGFFEQAHDEDLTLVSANIPGAAFESFIMRTMLGSALKSIDLDLSFFDSSHTNFSGSRQATNLYLKACEPKQRDVCNLRDFCVGRWVPGWFRGPGKLTLPAGMELADIRWRWLSNGVAPIDGLKDTKDDVLRVASLLDSHENRCAARGLDFYEVVDQLAAEQEYALSKKVQVATIADLALLLGGDEPTDDALPHNRQEAA